MLQYFHEQAYKYWRYCLGGTLKWEIVQILGQSILKVNANATNPIICLLMDSDTLQNNASYKRKLWIWFYSLQVQPHSRYIILCSILTR